MSGLEQFGARARRDSYDSRQQTEYQARLTPLLQDVRGDLFFRRPRLMFGRQMSVSFRRFF